MNLEEKTMSSEDLINEEYEKYESDDLEIDDDDDDF